MKGTDGTRTGRVRQKKFANPRVHEYHLGKAISVRCNDCLSEQQVLPTNDRLAFNEDVTSSLNLLLRQAKAGSVSSLGQLLQAYNALLLTVADQELGSDLRVKASPSDLVQESFLEAKRDFSHFKGQSAPQFQAWLRQLLLNNIANLARRYRRTTKRDISREVMLHRHSDPDSCVPFTEPSASSLAIKNETLAALHSAMARLPVHYQEVIRLRNYERESFEQIGLRLGRSTEAVRKLWTRALEFLERELAV